MAGRAGLKEKNPNCRQARGQPISFAESRIEAPIYDRTRLGVGDHIDGPATITQLDATLLLLGQTAKVYPLGSLVVHD